MLVLNAVMISVSVVNLLDHKKRTVEQVVGMTDNLAALLELNVADSVRRIDLGLLDIVDALEGRLKEGHIDADQIAQMLKLHEQRHPAVDAFRVSNQHGKVVWGKGVTPETTVTYATALSSKRISASRGRT